MGIAEPNHKPFELLTEEPDFPEEREGWKEILAKYDFPVVCNLSICVKFWY
jgi:sulfite oxidase